MSVKSGYSSYTCDRCAKQEYIDDNDYSKKANWTEITRITADKQSVKGTLCYECHKAYRTMAVKQDTEFNSFLAGGAE